MSLAKMIAAQKAKAESVRAGSAPRAQSQDKMPDALTEWQLPG